MKLLDHKMYEVSAHGNGYYVGELIKDNPVLDYIPTRASIGHFDGVNQFLKYLEDNCKKPEQGKRSADKRSEDRSFWEFEYKEALEVFTEDPRRVRKFDEKDDVLRGGDANGLKIVHDVEGDMIDIGRYLDGEPECMMSLTNGTPRGRRVNIILNLSQIWSVDTAFINHRARRLIRLVDWLESQGVRVQITAILSHECTHVEIEVKLYHEPLDLNSIAVVAHSDFLRRAGFRWIEYSKTFSYGYGSAVAFDDCVRRRLKKMFDNDSLEEASIYVGSKRGSDIDLEFDGLETRLTKMLMGDEEIEAMAVMV